MLWIPVTIGAAAAQLVRNALQTGLTGTIGTLGATMVRFVFAIPFVLAAYGAAVFIFGEAVPASSAPMVGWTLLGAMAQMSATALMLKAMDLRGFALAYAYIKTEPVLLALGGWWLLDDALPPLAWAGIVIATLGVIWAGQPRNWSLTSLRGEWLPVSLGLLGGGLFGLSSLSFRAGILAVEGASPLMASLHTMLIALLAQSAVLLIWLWLTDRKVIGATFAAWRPSLGAGFAGMLATMLWFIGFALTAAANVRTLGLIEMPVAALLNRRVSGKRLDGRQWSGIALVALGIGLLLRATL